jgi:hypothetical protein
MDCVTNWAIISPTNLVAQTPTFLSSCEKADKRVEIIFNEPDLNEHIENANKVMKNFIIAKY